MSKKSTEPTNSERKNIKKKINKKPQPKVESTKFDLKSLLLIVVIILSLLYAKSFYHFISSANTANKQQNGSDDSSSPRLDDKYPQPDSLKPINLKDGQKFDLTCSNEYKDRLQPFEAEASEAKKPMCTPINNCGRFSIKGLENNIITKNELKVLQNMAKLGTNILGGGAGGASIIEMHSSTASFKDHFVSLFNRMEQNDVPTIQKMKELYSLENLKVYASVQEKVKNLVANTFGVEADKLGLAAPTFFSKLEHKKAISMNDEYWHSHVDSLQYQAFSYTSLIYLSTYEDDFTGGRFIFEARDKKNPSEKYGSENSHIVEPTAGTISMFSSGHENKHRVEAVKSGTRYAFTMGFTCIESMKIKNPRLPEKWYKIDGKDEL